MTQRHAKKMAAENCGHRKSERLEIRFSSYSDVRTKLYVEREYPLEDAFFPVTVSLILWVPAELKVRLGEKVVVG